MSSVFPQGVKDLTISGPTNVGSNTSALRCKVILIAKFDFDAETNHELSVKKGDVVKLLDRLASGWVLVEFIDKIAAPGLVPSLYVDIAVNDPQNPITLSWLHGTGSQNGKKEPAFNDVQVQMLLAQNAPFSVNNKLYPLSASVNNYLMYENRFWYRVDVTYSSGEQGYLCRYYSDFYDLHVALLDHVNGISAGAKDPAVKLPKLPEPVPSQRRDSGEQKELFSQRCRELSAYMNGLIAAKQFQVCGALVDWLDLSYKDLPGFIVEEAPQDSSEEIAQRILPGSVILASKPVSSPVAELAKDLGTNSDSVKFVTPVKDGPRVIKPKNIYNHYQQAANAKINIARSLSTSDGRYPTRNKSTLERSRTVSNTERLQHSKSIKNTNNAENAAFGSNSVSPPASGPSSTSPSFANASPQLNRAKSVKGSPLMTPNQRYVHEKPQNHTPPRKAMSPMTPQGTKFNGNDTSLGLRTPQSASPTVFPPRKASFGTPSVRRSPTTSSSGKQVRCDIKTQTNDHIVVRLPETNDLETFKAAVYSKFAYNNLYIKITEDSSYEEIDSPELNVMQAVSSADTVYMLVT